MKIKPALEDGFDLIECSECKTLQKNLIEFSVTISNTFNYETDICMVCKDCLKRALNLLNVEV